MAASLLIRLSMVTVTLAAMFWIGWSVPASEAPEPLQAAVPQHTEARSLESLSSPLSKTGRRTPVEPRQTPVGAAGTLDVNQATKGDFERLPGIGPVLAGRIVAYRTAQGPFHDIEQLTRVKGIGRKTFERIRPHLAVVAPVRSITSRKTA